METRNSSAASEPLRTHLDSLLFILNSLYAISGPGRSSPKAQLFSDAETGKDQIQDVLGRGLAGEGVKSPERTIEIEQDHLVGNVFCVRFRSVIQGSHGGQNCLMMPQVRQHAGLCSGASGSERQNLFAER